MALTINWARFGAVLFDLDGVVTPTAEIHRRAWAALFAPWDFTDDDYLAYVDGRPRYDGVATFLASRGVTLPHGDPSDQPGDDTVCALGNRKDDMFMQTDTAESPWYVVEAEDKRRARINMIAHLLGTIDYHEVTAPKIKLPARPPSSGYQRTARALQREVPDHAASLV